MRAALLLAASLALAGVALAPTASAACPDTGVWVDDTCESTICTVKNVKGPWIHECWGIIGPPP